MAAQEYDRSSNFSYVQLQEESTRLLTALFEKDVMWNGRENVCNVGLYCADLAQEMSIEWRKMALVAAAAQRMPSVRGGSPVSDFELVNRTGQDLVIKWHSYADQELPNEIELIWQGFVNRTNSGYDFSAFNYGEDPNRGWYRYGGIFDYDEYGTDAGVNQIRQAYTFPLPRAEFAMEQIGYIVPLAPGDTWTPPSRAADPYTSLSWFGIYLRSDPNPGVECMTPAGAEYLANNYVQRSGRVLTGQEVRAKPWTADWYDMAMEYPLCMHVESNKFGYNAKLLANFQLTSGERINITSADSSAIADRVPYWGQDPEGLRYKIDEYILHDGVDYSQEMSHAACKAKCEADAACVMIRVNTTNEQDCLMGSSVGTLSSRDVDADVTSMRIISRTGNFVLE